MSGVYWIYTQWITPKLLCCVGAARLGRNKAIGLASMGCPFHLMLISFSLQCHASYSMLEEGDAMANRSPPRLVLIPRDTYMLQPAEIACQMNCPKRWCGAFVAEKRLNAARRASDPVAVSVPHLRSSNILPADRVNAKLACEHSVFPYMISPTY